MSQKSKFPSFQHFCVKELDTSTRPLFSSSQLSAPRIKCAIVVHWGCFIYLIFIFIRVTRRCDTLIRSMISKIKKMILNKNVITIFFHALSALRCQVIFENAGTCSSAESALCQWRVAIARLCVYWVFWIRLFVNAQNQSSYDYHSFPLLYKKHSFQLNLLYS